VDYVALAELYRCSVLPLPFCLINGFTALPSLPVIFRCDPALLSIASNLRVFCIPFQGQGPWAGSMSVRYTCSVSKIELRVVLCPKIYVCRRLAVRANLFLNLDFGIRLGWSLDCKSVLSNPVFPSVLTRLVFRLTLTGGHYH